MLYALKTMNKQIEKIVNNVEKVIIGKTDVILNVLSTLSFGAAAIFFFKFTDACTSLGGGIITDAHVGFGFIVGCILFAVNFILNVIVGKSFKAQKKEQPNMDEFVENELRELRQPKAE